MTDRETFVSWLGDTYPNLDEDARARLLQYGELLRSSSPRSGLVARGDLPRLYMRHLAECSDPAFIQALPEGGQVVDVGSGAGLPGIPLAILRPDLQVTLLEPRHKRGAFLERSLLALKLTHAEVRIGTLEDAARSEWGPWDGVVSRALAWTPPLVVALECVTRKGPLIRFGAPVAPEGIETIEIATNPERAVQVWPRERWSDLGTKA